MPPRSIKAPSPPAQATPSTPKPESPRARLKARGSAVLSDAEVLGLLLCTGGRESSAAERALRLDPGSTAAALTLGTLHLNAGRFDDAVATASAPAGPIAARRRRYEARRAYREGTP